MTRFFIFFIFLNYSAHSQENKEFILLYDEVGSNVLMKEYADQQFERYQFLRENTSVSNTSKHEIYMFDLTPIREITEDEMLALKATSVYDLKSIEPFELHLWLSEKSPYIKLIVPFYYHIPSKPIGEKNRYYLYYASYRGTRFQ